MEDTIFNAIQYVFDNQKNTAFAECKDSRMTHSLEVMNILLTEGFLSSTVVAGLLHDVFIESESVETEIRNRFGMEVVRILMHTYLKPSYDWYERQLHILYQLTFHWDDPVGAVYFADNLSHLRCFLQGH